MTFSVVHHQEAVRTLPFRWKVAHGLDHVYRGLVSVPVRIGPIRSVEPWYWCMISPEYRSMLAVVYACSNFTRFGHIAAPLPPLCSRSPTCCLTLSLSDSLTHYPALSLSVSLSLPLSRTTPPSLSRCFSSSCCLSSSRCFSLSLSRARALSLSLFLSLSQYAVNPSEAQGAQTIRYWKPQR